MGFKISDGKQDKRVVRMTPMPEDGTENSPVTEQFKLCTTPQCRANA